MKKILGLGVIAMLILSTLMSTIPVGAVSAGPYKNTNDTIKTITIANTKSLEKATYYRATVRSSWHGLKKNWSTLTTHLVIGTAKETKFFVYSAESKDKMSYARKSVHDLVTEFEKANPAYKVVAAVNGDFFNTNTGEPEEPMIQNGDMLKSYLLPDMTGRGMVGVDDKTGKAIYYTIGGNYSKSGYGTKFTFDGAYQVQVLGPSKTNPIISYKSTLAQAPSKTIVSFTTSDFGQGQYAGKTVYVVDLERYRMDTGSHNKVARTDKNYFVEGKIISKIKGTNNMKPSKGQAYIAVNDTAQAPYIKVGAYIKCQKVLNGVWENVSNAIGFKQQILAEGNLLLKNAYGTYHTAGDENETLKWTEDIYEYPHCWKARTAIGFKADGTPIFMVIPTTNPLGATYYEMASQFKALGCTNAFVLDGGGSSTMVIREGNSINTVVHAEGGSGSEGRQIANIAILAVRKAGVALPKQDKVVAVETEAKTDKATDKATDKTTDAVDQTEDVVDTEIATSTEVVTDPMGDTSIGETTVVPGATDTGVVTNPMGSETLPGTNVNTETKLPIPVGGETDSVTNPQTTETPTIGCGATVAVPAVIVTGGLAAVGVKKKRKKDE